MNKLHYPLLAILLLLATFGYSQDRYHLIYEKDLGQHFGGENLLLANHLWTELDKELLSPNLFPEEKVWGNRIYRFGKLLLLDYPFAFLIPSLQHEYFGHGFRAREYGSRVTNLQITLPPPFQLETPSVNYEPIIHRTAQEQIAMIISGVEANAIFSEKMHRNVLLRETINYHDALLYIYANNDLTGYVTFGINLGGDVNAYLNALNDYYSEGELKKEKLFRYGVLGILFDPVNYYAFASIFNYGWRGQSDTNIPFIFLDERVKFLPKIGFILSPFGPEVYLDNYLKIGDQIYSLYMGQSDKTFAKFWRVKGQFWNVPLATNLYLGGQLQLWQQPDLTLWGDRQNTTVEGFGGAFIGRLNYDWQQAPLLGLMLEAGYKSGGFMQGERLEKGLILRGGLSVNFRK